MDETSTKHHDFAQLLFLIKSLFSLLQDQLSLGETVFSALNIKEFMHKQEDTKRKEWLLLHNHTRRFALNFRNKYPLELMITNQICDYLNQYAQLFKLLYPESTENEDDNLKYFSQIHSILDKIQRIKFLLIISIINHEDYCSENITEN